MRAAFLDTRYWVARKIALYRTACRCVSISLALGTSTCRRHLQSGVPEHCVSEQSGVMSVSIYGATSRKHVLQETTTHEVAATMPVRLSLILGKGLACAGP